MKERQFLKEINTNKKGSYKSTIELVNKLLEENTEISVYNKKNIFLRFFRHRNKTAKQIILKNFEQILNRTSNSDLKNLIMILFGQDSTSSIINEKFESIIKRFSIVNNNEDESLFYQKIYFLKELKKIPDGEKIIKDNYEIILKNSENKDLFQIVQILKGISKEIDDVLEQQLEENHLEVAKSLLTTYKIEDIDNKKKSVQDYTLTLSTMIEELLKSENCRWIDINRIGCGSYSDVYAIGNKILKIGEVRASYEIPNHPRILQPLIRINFLDEKRKNKPFACVEITDKVETVDKTNENLEELYKVYAELREAGIIWTDAIFENVGILTKPNVPSLNGQDMNVAPNSVGFSNNNKGKPLDKGDMVILDTDYLYKENSSNILWAYRGYSEGFEKRWQQERQQKIAKEHLDDKENIRKDVGENER